MRRARPTDRISEFVPQDDRVLIGVRNCAGTERLIIKMSQRKNLSGGCILKRLCLCGDSSHQARKISPPHRIWPLILSRVGRGELLFPGFSRNNVNRILKTTLVKIGFPGGEKFTSKAFRRGATQELLLAGNTLEVIKGSGGWWGSGFRSYVDLEMDNAFRISRCLIVLSDGSSSEDEKRAKQDQRRRKQHRRKPYPKAETSVSSPNTSTSSGTP